MTLSLLDYFNGYNNTFSYKYRNHSSKMYDENNRSIFPFEMSLSKNKYDKQMISTIKIENDVTFSFVHLKKYLMIFFKDENHTLQVNS